MAAPTKIALSKLTVGENVTAGVVGNLVVTDPDSDTTFTFTVSDTRFTVSGTPGAYKLQLKAGNSLDFETVQTIDLTVTATDGAGGSKTEAFTIGVTNAKGITVTGTTLDDTFSDTVSPVGKAKPSNEDDTIDGGAGNDTIYGLGADDTLKGGLGNDTLYGGVGNDTLFGGAGADTLDGGTAGSVGDTVSYLGSTVGVTVNLTVATAQTSAGDASGDILIGIENLIGSALADTLTGGSGDNVIEGGAGSDTLAGGTHSTYGDTVSYRSATAGVKINLGLTTAQATGGAGTDTISGFENFLGSKFADTVEASNVANYLDGGAGIDTVSYASDTTGITVRLGGTISGGNAAGDTIVNFEHLTGGSGNDTLGGNAGNNNIDGGGGNDTISGYGGADILKGGLGTDTIDFAWATKGVTVSLIKTGAQGIATGLGTVALSGFETLNGSGFADILTGDGDINTINGQAGDDMIDGLGGADKLNGGANGSGGDTVTYMTSKAAVTVDLGLATAQTGSATGNAFGDVLSGFENLIGSGYADTLKGDANANVIEGGNGNDTIDGAGGNDTVSYSLAKAGVTIDLAAGTATSVSWGQVGSDKLSNIENILGSTFADIITGSTGNNVITGGKGADLVSGGTGTDTFNFASIADAGDIISDFVHGTDKLQLAASGFAGSTAGTVKFASGATPTSGTGTGWLLYDTDDGKLYYDADGTLAGAPVLLCTLSTKPGLTATDIVIV